MSDISKSIQKVDNEEKLNGKALYIDDMSFDGMLYARTFRSTISKGKIISRRYPELPEGYFIVDYKDIPGNNFIQIIFEDWPIFAEKEVNYYGDPIALVVGPDKAIILDICDQIQMEYEELTPIYDYTDSVIDYEFSKGEGEKVFEDAKQIISYTYDTGYQEHVYIEPQGVIGTYEDKRVNIYGSMQCPYYIKNALINTLGCKDDYPRVVQTTTGGAFGGKEEFPSLISCQVAVAVEKIKKPIKLVFNRTEDMQYSTKRHPSTIKMEAAIGNDNDILGFRSHVSLDSGAFIGLSGVVLQRAMIASTGVYTINNLHNSGDVYRTNTVPNGAFRGFGAPQMFFAIEMFMQHIADTLGIDSLKLREKYLSKQNDKTSTNGTFRDISIMPEMIKRAREISDYDEKIANPRPNTGIGMSWFLHGCGFTGSGEQDHIKAVIKLKKDTNDQVTILVAATDMGQGIKTSMRKLVAHILDLPISQVIMNNPDTDLVPDSGPTVASRTMMIVGGLVARASKRLKDTWIDGQEQVFEEHYKQPEYVKWDDSTLQGDAYPGYSWGVHVVEVSIDPISYEVSLDQGWAVYDVGKAIDEQIILGQADGGFLQGVSYGYLENMVHKEGRIQQKTITDYIIPTAVDGMPIVNEIYENPFPLGPFGAKGAGELTLIGGAPAVALAIENAIGCQVTRIPVTPEYIMSLKKTENKGAK